MKYITDFPVFYLNFSLLRSVRSFSVVLFSAVSRNVRTADGSGDYNEKCCTVVAWCKQHGDPSIILTERERKGRFEHRAKNQTAVFQLGATEGIKLTRTFCSRTKHRIWPAWFVPRGFSVLGVSACLFVFNLRYSLSEKSPWRPQRVLFVLILKRKIGDQNFPSICVLPRRKNFINTLWRPHFSIWRLK